MNYLNELYFGGDQGHLAIWHKSSRRTRWFPIAERDEAAAYMKQAAETDDVYFGWGLQQSSLGPGKRGDSAGVCALPGFMFDIDLVSVEGAHASDALPKSPEEVAAFIEEVEFIKPTAIRHSGNGLYYDWLFRATAVFASREESERAAAVSRRLQAALRALGDRRHAWKLDNTADLARVTRMPGTRNHKTDPAKEVRLLQYEPGRRYPIEEIEAGVVALEERIEPTRNTAKPKPKKRQSSADPDKPDRKPNFDSVLAGCAWAESCVARASRLPEPEWYAFAGIAARCEDGEARFHEMSASDPRYDEVETQSKLEQAIAKSGPRTCGNIATELGFEGCRTCVLANLSSPIRLGYQRPEVASLMRNNVYDVSTRRYLDTRTGRMLDHAGFSEKFRHEIAQGSVHQLLMTKPQVRKVDAIDYLPGHEEAVIELGPDHVVYNSWTRSALEAEAGDQSIILDHLAFLNPKKEEHDHFLNYLAHAVQKPGDKIRHALLIIGKQGTGKSFLLRLLQLLLGDQNVRRAESEDLTSTWTSRLGNCQALVVEELDTFGRLEVYNRLKPWTTEEQVVAEEKHVKKHEVRTPRMIIAFSNHSAPTRIQEGDRRFWVTQSDSEKKDQAYYRRLFTDGLEQASAFLDFLSKRDIQGFDASAPPPMTESKGMIVASSKPICTQEIEAMRDEGHGLFLCDLLAFDDVRNELMRRLGNKMPSRTQVTDALKAIGAVPLGQIRLGGNARARLWAWQNIEKWCSASAEERRMTHLKVIPSRTLADRSASLQ